MEDKSIFGFMPVTRYEFEQLRQIVKESIKIQQDQMKIYQGLQQQISALHESVKIIQKLV